MNKYKEGVTLFSMPTEVWGRGNAYKNNEGFNEGNWKKL